MDLIKGSKEWKRVQRYIRRKKQKTRLKSVILDTPPLTPVASETENADSVVVLHNDRGETCTVNAPMTWREATDIVLIDKDDGDVVLDMIDHDDKYMEEYQGILFDLQNWKVEQGENLQIQPQVSLTQSQGSMLADDQAITEGSQTEAVSPCPERPITPEIILTPPRPVSMDEMAITERRLEARADEAISTAVITPSPSTSRLGRKERVRRKLDQLFAAEPLPYLGQGTGSKGPMKKKPIKTNKAKWLKTYKIPKK